MTDKYEHLATALPKVEKPPVWGTPEPGTFFSYPYRTTLYDDVLIHRLELDDRDRLLGFALVHVTQSKGEDHMVAEVDTRHGHVHLHQYRPGNIRVGDPRTIRMLQARLDVEIGYEDAMGQITEQWAEHKRRWQRGG